MAMRGQLLGNTQMAGSPASMGCMDGVAAIQGQRVMTKKDLISPLAAHKEGSVMGKNQVVELYYQLPEAAHEQLCDTSR